MKLKIKKRHALEWLLEMLEDHPGYNRRKMFGCEAAYINGRLSIILADGDEPWNGLMVATEREYHEALRKEWPKLESHPILGKWLYLSQTDPDFENVATDIVSRVRRGHPLIGVEPKPKKRRAK